MKQVHLDNDASEVDILGHFGTFWDISGQFGTIWKTLMSLEHLDFSQSFPTMFTHNRLTEKKMRSGRTHGPTDGRTDPPIEMRGRI